MTFRWPIDLVVTAGWAAAAAVVVVSGGVASPIRGAVVLPLLILLPGYAALSALYPRGPRAPDARTLSPAERLVLSVALSLGVVPLVAFVLNFTVGIYTRPLVLSVTALTILLAGWALFRRLAVPPRHRFNPRDFIPRSPEGGFPGGGYSLLLAVSVVVLGATGAYAAVHDPARGQFTELYLLAETDSGDLSMEPVDEAVANGGSITIAVENHEGESTPYTVTILSQEVEDGQVVEEERLDRQSIEVSEGETAHLSYPVPDDVGDRLVVRLHRSDPDGPAYRTTKVWA